MVTPIGLGDVPGKVGMSHLILPHTLQGTAMSRTGEMITATYNVSRKSSAVNTGEPPRDVKESEQGRTKELPKPLMPMEEVRVTIVLGA
jgi:hypothetical protein